MSADSSWDVQTGIFTHLTGNASLTDLLADGAGSILDHVPPGTAFPYVVLGETQAVPMDTQGSSGNDISVSLHTYSRGGGMQEVKNIMTVIYDALHNAFFDVPNQTLILCQCRMSETKFEDDGQTRHGIQHFHIITEPA